MATSELEYSHLSDEDYPSVRAANRFMRAIHILPFLTILAASATAQWQQITSPNNPGQRRSASMAYHPGLNALVMYGGLSSTPAQALSDTWAFTTSWTQLSIPGGAPPRWGHQMVTNTATGNILTFGGRSPTVSSLSNDTSEFDGTTWTNVPTANSPSARFLYGMVYDSARNVVVLFGGRNALGANNETWEFDGTTWSQVTTANSPPAREEMGMIYDSSLNRTIMFGGCNENTSQIFGDTWQYDGTDWIQLNPITSPSPRFRGVMEFDSDRSRSVYFGGYDGTMQLTETFEFTGGEWLQVPTGATTPTSTTEMASGYDPMRQELTLFGGFGTTFNNDTWQYIGPTDGSFTLFGSGCDTAQGPVGFTGTVPNINTTLDLTFSNVGSAESVIVSLGLSNQIWNGIALPFDLAIVGLAGCDLLAAATFVDIRLVTGTTAVYSIAIPNVSALVSQSLYCQGFPVSKTLGIVFEGSSRGGRALIGQ